MVACSLLVLAVTCLFASVSCASLSVAVFDAPNCVSTLDTISVRSSGIFDINQCINTNDYPQYVRVQCSQSSTQTIVQFSGYDSLGNCNGDTAPTRRLNVNVTADTRNAAAVCLTATYYAGYTRSVTVSGISCDPNAVDRTWQMITAVVIVVVLVAFAALCVAVIATYNCCWDAFCLRCCCRRRAVGGHVFSVPLVNNDNNARYDHHNAVLPQPPAYDHDDDNQIEGEPKNYRDNDIGPVLAYGQNRVVGMIVVF